MNISEEVRTNGPPGPPGHDGWYDLNGLKVHTSHLLFKEQDPVTKNIFIYIPGLALYLIKTVVLQSSFTIDPERDINPDKTNLFGPDFRFFITFKKKVEDYMGGKR